MARRRKEESPLFDAVFELLKITPIWVGPTIAVIAFIGLRYVAPHFFAAKPSGADVGFMIRGLLPLFSWIALGGVLVAWIAAEVSKFSNRRLLDRQEGIETIREMAWPDFERLVCEAYRRKGYLAQVVGSTSGDGGVDVELRGRGELVLVQCKQWRAFKVGVTTVREMLGVVVSRKADSGIIVTSGRFTQEAVRFAEQNPNIKLVAGPQLAELIASVQNGRTDSPLPAPPADSHTSAVTRESETYTPVCPSCGANMIRRVARRGQNAGSAFWGCAKYPACSGTRPV